MLKNFHGLKTGQQGFTLVELLVAIPISALVVAAATSGLITLLRSGDADTHMYALRQVQTAGYWVSTDGLQTEDVVFPVPATSDNVGVDLTTAGKLASFMWVDLDPSVYEIYEVEYWLIGSEENLKLERRETVKSWLDPANTDYWRHATTMVSQYITRATFWYDRSKPEMLYFQVTSTVGQGSLEEQTETRLYQIRPRALEA